MLSWLFRGYRDLQAEADALRAEVRSLSALLHEEAMRNIRLDTKLELQGEELGRLRAAQPALLPAAGTGFVDLTTGGAGEEPDSGPYEIEVSFAERLDEAFGAGLDLTQIEQRKSAYLSAQLEEMLHERTAVQQKIAALKTESQ